MVDVVDKATRSRMMAGIRGANTSPEKQVRSLLHLNGFRFRIHRKDLPGKPDIVLPKYRAVILIHGCFWHRHKCHMFKWPSSNTVFWRAKINSNAKRDARNLAALHDEGWRVLTIWECALRGPGMVKTSLVVNRTAAWLRSKSRKLEISGTDIR